MLQLIYFITISTIKCLLDADSSKFFVEVLAVDEVEEKAVWVLLDLLYESALESNEVLWELLE